MSEFSKSDFTGVLKKAKSHLDVYLRIPIKEDAKAIISEMKKRNTEINKSSLGDLDKRLLEILGNDGKYLVDNHRVLRGYKLAPKSLFEVEAEKEAKEKGAASKATGRLFDDIERNARIIGKYENDYVNNLKGINELDKEFLDRLNAVHILYRSSSEYMERTVKRLLADFNERNKENNDGDGFQYDLSESARVLILKHFIRQFDWFNDIKSFDVKDTKELVTEKYDGKYELIDDGIFSNISNPDTAFFGRRITEGFIVAVSKLQGIIKYKAPFIKTDSSVIGMIKSIIVQEKLKDSGELEKAQLLSECFNEDSYEVTLDWFKDPVDMGINEELLDVLCRVVKDELLSEKAKENKAKTIGECFKDGSIPTGSECFRSFDEIEMTPELCKSFYKTVRKAPNEDEKRSETAKKGKAETLAECFVSYSPDMKITSINSIAMYFYKRISDELEKIATGCTVKDSTYNDAIKKGGELYDKNRRRLKFYNYDLLQIADDLSRAKFSPHGKTREYLYLFAIAFEMTSSGYTEDSYVIDNYTKKRVLKEDPGKLTDIQKNLFFDYYSDNIVNNIKSVSGFSEKGSTASVDGYGINYKNFAEVTFLWCIDRRDKTAKDKLKLAYEIIDYCKKNGKTEEDFIKANGKIDDDKLTQAYKEHYSYMEAEIDDVSKVKEYLIEKYACRTSGSVMKLGANGRRAGLELEKQQKRVKNLLETVEREMFGGWDSNEVLDYILDKDPNAAELFILSHYLRETKCRTCERRKDEKMYPFCHYFFDKQILTDKKGNTQLLYSCKDYFPDIKIDEESLKKAIKSVVYIGEDTSGDFERRITTLSRHCSQEQAGLKRVLEEIEKRISLDTLYLEKKDVSRTSILALCYFEMVLQNYLYRFFCDETKEAVGVLSFDEFYKQFCEGRTIGVEIYNEEKAMSNEEEYEEEYVEFVFPGADEILRKSGYQQINSKNIFDVYVIFMAYKDNYKKLYEMPGALELLEDANKIIANLEIMKKEIEANRNKELEISEDR